MSGLKKVSNKYLQNSLPAADWLKIGADFEVLGLNNNKPIKSDDSSKLINLEIAFQKCKRTGVFD